MEANIVSYGVSILTSAFYITGELRPRGNPGVFINDQSYKTLTVYGAHLQPIPHGARVGAMSMEELYVPKGEVQILALSDFPPSEANLLATQHPMICLTDTYIVRAAFHSGPETKAADVFYFTGGPFFPGSDAEVFPLKPLASDVSLRTPLAYFHRDAIRAFYEQS